MKACQTCDKRYNREGNEIASCPEFHGIYRYYQNQCDGIDPPCWVERREDKSFFVIWDGDSGPNSEWVQIKDVNIESAEKRARGIAKDIAANNPGKQYFLLQAKTKYIAGQVEEIELNG